MLLIKSSTINKVHGRHNPDWLHVDWVQCKVTPYMFVCKVICNHQDIMYSRYAMNCTNVYILCND